MIQRVEGEREDSDVVNEEECSEMVPRLRVGKSEEYGAIMNMGEKDENAVGV